MKKKIPLTRIGFFNPGRLTDEEIELTFVTRVSFFQYVFDKIVAEKPDSIPQHYLIIGQRGMGKTTLLSRIAAELRKPEFAGDFIALTFPEEQYNIDRISKFWLNCLDALADALDRENKENLTRELDSEIKGISKNMHQEPKTIWNIFEKWITKVERRPILLVDNLNLIFDKITTEEQHQLRSILMSRNAPILLGASATSMEDTSDYGAPFYDAFQIHYLKKLTLDESIEVLQNLAEITGNEGFAHTIHESKGRLGALYQLTGGTPRTIAMLFPLIQNGFSNEVSSDLDAILDVVTPLYKARFEELSDQLQIVLDAIALHWDPMTIEQLRNVTQLENAQLSGQLKRLVDVGWIQKLDAFGSKGSAYEISERFFNVWYLMRRSSRRQKRELYCLSKFLETFYGDDIERIARQRLASISLTPNHISYDLALADTVKDKELSEKLKNKSYQALFEFIKSDGSVLKFFSIPEDKVKDQILHLVDFYFDKIKAKEYVECSHIVQQLLILAPNNANINFIAGIVEEALENFKEAELFYLRAIELNGQYGAYWMFLGDLYNYKFKDFSMAEGAYLKGLEIDNENSNIWFNLGEVYHKHLSNYSEAERAYLKSIDFGSIVGDVWYNLGNLYQDHFGEYEKSEGFYLKAIELDSKDAKAWFNLGNLYHSHLRKYNESEQAYLKAIQFGYESGFLWGILGNLYFEHLEKFQEAERAYLKAIELDDSIVVIWKILGSLYHNNLGRHDEAESAYLKSIELDEKDSKIWALLGNLYHEYLEKYERAESAYLKSIELDEKEPRVWGALGQLYHHNLGKHEEAEEAYLEAIALDNKLFGVWNRLGNLYQDNLKKFQEAEQAYLNAIKVEGDNIYARYNLIFLYRDKLKQIEKAKEVFMSIERNEELEDSYMLNQAIFAYYENNAGIAKDFLTGALRTIKDSLSSNTQDDWWRTGAVAVKLGFGEHFLQVLEENGYDVILRPYYVAIQALLQKKPDLFFNSIAAEVREPAKKIMEWMKKYME
ncbi:tetratricopeptide repeat protein [Emticicia fluvialis]|uniref:tetratricopeptide repeat protein n=1 Tax=Emticicia fluvialis TaxID=2974474 RepID=UPI002165D07B|nr:tetratricopeptide repeat protein [Emticicia fluvialis]